MILQLSLFDSAVDLRQYFRVVGIALLFCLFHHLASKFIEVGLRFIDYYRFNNFCHRFLLPRWFFLIANRFNLNFS